jgi:alcohol dehydrogenase YqhD (iron-dependent ADH family)
VKSFTFQNPTLIDFGEGSLKKLGTQIKPYAKKVLLVYGGGSIKKTGLYDQVLQQLTKIGIETIELAGVEPNPRVTTVRRGIALCREHGVDFILAVGGGSVIDAAKAVAAGVPYDGDVWDFLIHKAQVKSALPLGTVLTLSATGSEMNGNAVITHWELKLKKAFGSIHVYPKFSILDPTLTYSLPREQTCNGIVDMMSHVFEQYFSLTPDTPLQERLCESILQTVIENGEIALANPTNYEARANLMLCGTYALNGGMISVGVHTDWATHIIEHEVSAIYDIPHGVGLAILFPNWMQYVYRQRIDRFVQYATRVWKIDPTGKSTEQIALEGITTTREYFNRIGMPARLRDVDIDDTHIDEMAKKSVATGKIGSFQSLDEQDVRAILLMSL